MAAVLRYATSVGLGLQLELKEGTDARRGARCLEAKHASSLQCAPLTNDPLVEQLVRTLRDARFPPSKLIVSSFDGPRLAGFLRAASATAALATAAPATADAHVDPTQKPPPPDTYRHTKLVLDAAVRSKPTPEQQHALFVGVKRSGADSVSILYTSADASLVARAQRDYNLSVEIGVPMPRSKGWCIHEQPPSAAHVEPSVIRAILELNANFVCTDRPDLVLAARAVRR